MNYDKTEMNSFVQNLYDQKMQEGKHGHYETMFHVVHQAIKRLAQPEQQAKNAKHNGHTAEQLEKQLLALGIPDWATARYLMSEAAAMLRSQAAEIARLRAIARLYYGYAKGNYMGTCIRCNATMELVDKRCHVCEQCAREAIAKGSKT